MKKRSLLMLLTGMLAVSGSLVSCDDPQGVEDEPNTLKVEPAKNISFEAADNEDVVLTVTTDATTWEFTKPEWVTATKSTDGKTLTVNASENDTEGSRAGRLEITAGNAKAVVINISQKKPVEVPKDNTLSVTPSDNIAFNASGNNDVVLTVDTDASSWDFMTPDWVTATKSTDGNTLTLNAQNNDTGASRVGRLIVSAGNAKAVTISITQKKVGGGDEPDGVAGSLQDKSGKSEVNIEIPFDEAVSANVNFKIAENVSEAVNVEVFFDAAYLAEYNFLNGTSFKLFPESMVTIAGSGDVTLAAGSTDSGDILISFDTESEDIEYNVSYLVPLYVKAKSSNVAITHETCRVNYILKRKNPKEVQNVLYFEVNDTNPLNALEYVLEDGRMFFDAVVLFAANINYDDAQDVVYLHNNPNVTALLEETDVYIQPLRKKGIKVWLGILGNHTAAGLSHLSDEGCVAFAEELAQAVKEYKLDGVNFDDEYTNKIAYSKWLLGGGGLQSSQAAAARLCYETKKAMKRVCGEEKDMTVYYLGNIRSSMPSVTIDGVTHQPGSFVDQASADYGSAAYPMSGMTKKQCAGMSVELGKYQTMSESTARNIKNNGYGWIMWFNLSPTAAHYSNSVNNFKNASKGLYDTELVTPTHYYKKLGEGSYDPVRYAK